MFARKALFGCVLVSLAALLPARSDATLLCSGTICTDTTPLALAAATDIGGPSFSTFLHLAQFDPGLGTLDSARLLIDATKLTRISLTAFNPDDGQGVQEVVGAVSTISGNPYFFFHFPDPGPSQIHHIPTASPTVSCNLAPNDGCSEEFVDTLPVDEFVGILDTAPMIGSGEFDVFAGVTGLADFCQWTSFPPFNPQRTCNSDMSAVLSGTLTVEYLFTPAVTAQVPTPATLPLLGSSLLSLTGLRFARRRRSQP